MTETEAENKKLRDALAALVKASMDVVSDTRVPINIIQPVIDAIEKADEALSNVSA